MTKQNIMAVFFCLAVAALADNSFTSGLEDTDVQPAWTNSTFIIQNVTGTSCRVSSVQSSSGVKSLVLSGTATGGTQTYCHYKVFDVNIAVNALSTLSYRFFAGNDLSRYCSVDLYCTDGTVLRDSGAVDTAGVRMKPTYARGVTGRWISVRCNIGNWLAGKTIDRIHVAFSCPGSTGLFAAYVDDLNISPGSFFTTGFEPGNTQPDWIDSIYSNVNMTSTGCASVTNRPYIGDYGLTYHAVTSGSTPANCYFKVFETSIPVDNSTQLSYWLYTNNEESRHTGIDLVCSDGTRLIDTEAIDTAGISVHPVFARGEVQQWINIRCRIGNWLAGKTVTKILVGFDADGVSANLRATVDDLVISSDLKTGFEEGDLNPTWIDSKNNGTAVIDYRCSPSTEQYRSGMDSLSFSGIATSTAATCYFKVYDVNIPIDLTTRLSYEFLPVNELSRHSGVDLICTDGTTLRGSEAKDILGASMHPSVKRGVVGQWTRIACRIGEWLEGKTIDKVLVAFDYAGSDPLGRFSGYIDELNIKTDPDFSLLGSDGISRPNEEFYAGVGAVTFKLDWRSYEPANNSFSSSYIADRLKELSMLKVNGKRIVMNPVLHGPPLWIYTQYQNARYKNQYGDINTNNYAANWVFNKEMRSEITSYLARIRQDFGDVFDYIRLGPTECGEMRYPSSDYAGESFTTNNCFWCYDTNAQALSPVPGLKPGDTMTTNQARRFLEYYFESLADLQNYILDALRTNFPSAKICPLYTIPIQPEMIEAAITNNLTGNNFVIHRLVSGQDWPGLLGSINDSHIANVLPWNTDVAALTPPLQEYPLYIYLAMVSAARGIDRITGEPAGSSIYPDGIMPYESMLNTVAHARHLNMPTVFYWREDVLVSPPNPSFADYANLINGFPEANREVALRAKINDRYVKVNSTNNQLLANSTSVAEEQIFYMTDLTNGLVAFRSKLNDRYVTSFPTLIASKTTVGEAEKFKLFHMGFGRVAIVSAATNRYVKAVSGTAPLTASSTDITFTNSCPEMFEILYQ